MDCVVYILELGEEFKGRVRSRGFHPGGRQNVFQLPARRAHLQRRRGDKGVTPLSVDCENVEGKIHPRLTFEVTRLRRRHPMLKSAFESEDKKCDDLKCLYQIKPPTLFKTFVFFLYQRATFKDFFMAKLIQASPPTG